MAGCLSSISRDFVEEPASSSDMDFTLRLCRAGGKILLVSEIVSDYYAEPDPRTFLRHNVADDVGELCVEVGDPGIVLEAFSSTGFCDECAWVGDTVGFFPPL